MVEACWEEACRLVKGSGLPLGPWDLPKAIRFSAETFWSDPERHRTGRLDLPAARRLVVADALESLGFPRPDLARAIADRYTGLRRESAVLLPGAREALAGLRERGVRMVLVTNGASDLQRS
ncbi:MAG: hypothetical protein L6R43_10630 [Planctomycetes bacterium]|nr:hypothetical protein [Planctomycetota bacterium]